MRRSVFSAVPALADLGVCFARALSARTRVRNAVHRSLVDLLRAGSSVCLLRDFSTGGEVPARTRNGLSPAVESRRLLRLHHHRHAGNGRRFSDAGDNLCAGADRPGHRRIHGQDLENRADRYPDWRGRSFAHQRHSKHAAVCGADDGSLRGFHLYRLDFQQAANSYLNASKYAHFARLLRQLAQRVTAS